MASILLYEKSPTQLLLLAAAALVPVFLTWCLVSYLTSPLRKYPGPFWARWTNLWRLYQVYSQKYQWTIKKLHEKHGPVVRIGPNMLDLDYPEMIKTIYSTDGKWRKFYHNSSAIIDGKITYHLFSTTDQAAHARMKRPIVKYYSMSSILHMEPQMNDVITDFCRHLEDRFMEGSGRGSDFDFGKWIAYYTWDLISSATFSKRFGYMEKGYDFDKTIHISDQVADYTAMVGQMPFLDFLLDKNPIMRIGPPNLGNVTDISMRNLISRTQDPEAEKKTDSQKDFLDHFLEAKQKSPDVVDNKIILGYLQVNMLAGADTTAITLRAIFDNLITTPRAMKRLEEEILAADLDPYGIVPYNTARSMPYLEGVIRESMRMHPGVGMLLERYVPETGVTLPDGSFLPSGVGVGISPYVVGRNKSVWGENADTFYPERWLKADGEDNEVYQQRLRGMNAADLTFGNGSRICIGRNIALLEIYKVVPTILLRYKVLPCDSKYDFKIISSWFSRQSGLVCKLEKRQVSHSTIKANVVDAKAE